MPIVVAKPHTPEWYGARGTGIGASEIGIAAGLSPYQTPRELYHRKRGELPPIEDNDAMRLGRLLEPVVKSEFTTRTGIVLADPEPPMYRHARHTPIVATPDGIIDDVTIFEAKTASWRMKSQWGDQESDAIPDHYLCQTQAQMAVMDAAVCHVAVLFDGATLKTYRVLRNDELIRHLIAAALELWERIKDGNPPDVDWEHASTPGLIKELHQTVNDTRIVLTADEVDAWETYERLGSPEGELALSEALIYLATAPKSNANYVAYKAARAAARENGSLMPPKHILNAPTKLMKNEGYGKGYEYDHDTPEAFSGQNYFPEDMPRENFYDPPERGFEREIRKRLDYWAKLRKEKGDA